MTSETELLDLARRAQRRALANTTAYFADVASATYPSLGYVPSLESQVVVWNGTHGIAGPVNVPFTLAMTAGAA